MMHHFTTFYASPLPCLLLCIAILAGCQVAEQAAPASTLPTDALDKALAAHGGLDVWQNQGSLSYTMVKGERTEQHLIDLKTRNILHSGDGYAFGFDGANVWVSPVADAYPGNPLFAKGLDFYFFAMPFVLADPGTIRESLGLTNFNGASYETMKISFEAGTGDSPDDYYIAHFDPATHQLRYLLYTVTFMSQTPNEQYYARAYDAWESIDGLLLPTKMTSYAWDSETRTTGETYREVFFSDIALATTQPAATSFAKPATAEIVQPVTP